MGMGQNSTNRSPATTPVTGKIMYPTFVGQSGATRKECWGATSTCGAWKYDREDEPGTPWTITHIPTGRTLTATNLLAARPLDREWQRCRGDLPATCPDRRHQRHG